MVIYPDCKFYVIHANTNHLTHETLSDCKKPPQQGAFLLSITQLKKKIYSKKKAPHISVRGSRMAATYSPTFWGSTIGAGRLNFSVRNGKRWNPAAIAT